MLKGIISQQIRLRHSLNNKVEYCINSSQLSQPKRENEDHIASLLRNNLKATYLKIIDTTVNNSSCGTMLKMTIESPLFSNKSKVEQHQMVTDVLKQKMQEIHGFNLKTITPQTEKVKTENF